MSGAEEARLKAREIVARFPVRTPPVPVERIVKSLDIVLQYAPLEDEISGMAFTRDGIRIIGVNTLHHPNRQRFTIAHELGHHILHADQLSAEVHVDKTFRVMMRDMASSSGIVQAEREANAFASELLMPLVLLRQHVDEAGLDLDDDDRIEVLSRKFRVSNSAMRLRLGSWE